MSALDQPGARPTRRDARSGRLLAKGAALLGLLLGLAVACAPAPIGLLAPDVRRVGEGPGARTELQDPRSREWYEAEPAPDGGWRWTAAGARRRAEDRYLEATVNDGD